MKISKLFKLFEFKNKAEKRAECKGVHEILLGWKQVYMREKPALLPFDKNPKDYDILFIGTPVWAFTYAAPFNTFFHEAGLKNKKIALFVCHSGGIKATFNDMRKALSGNEIIGEIDFVEPLKNDANDSAAKAKQWAGKY